MVIGESQGRGRRRGQGRGLRHVMDCDKLTLVDSVDDMDIPSPKPPKSTEGHQYQEQFDDILLSGVASTACCK
jgi:hypothetical protein